MSIFPFNPTVTANQCGVLISFESPGSLDTMLLFGTSDYFKYWMRHILGCRSPECMPTVGKEEVGAEVRTGDFREELCW